MRPVSETIGFLERADFEVIGLQNLRTHYARTANVWRENFESNYDELVALAGEAVARVWRLYLIGGAMSFADGRMGVDQILSVRT
jgi:cyclopropane-fatty-acyl-phospholipid synthase